MKLMKWTVGLLVLTSTFAPLQAGPWSRVKEVLGIEQKQVQATIKVKIATDIPGTTVDIAGKYNIYDPKTKKRLATRFNAKGGFAEAINEGIRWGETFPGVFQIAFVPDEPTTQIWVNGVPYFGSVFLYNVQGKLSIVNEVPIENYVDAIMTSQFNRMMPVEALAALAISLRTDAYNEVMTASSRFWHVDANKVGYKGASSSSNREVKVALQSTRHLILSTTRAFTGQVTPCVTNALEKQQNPEKISTPWSLEQAEKLASQGKEAERILATFFPNTSIEMVPMVPQTAGRINSRQPRGISDTMY
jgi:stage II sporulation protein D